MNRLYLHLGIGTLALAGLLLEISLTQFFSVLFFPPVVFAVLSLAILGIGLGAALAAWKQSMAGVERVPAYLALAAISILALTVAGVMNIHPWLRYSLFILVMVPYFLLGLSLASLFSYAAKDSPQLYQADLVGAGAGALLAVPALNSIGALNALILAAFLLALAAIFVRPRPIARSSMAILALTPALLISNMLANWLDLPAQALSTGKPILESLISEDSAILRTHWDAFARTDLVDPGDGGAYRIFINGAAGSVMPPAQNNDFLWQDIGLFPFATEQPERVFLSGPGGGLDVWFAAQINAETIMAVEVNPASVALVRQYSTYNGGLYALPGVNVLVDEARSVLRRQGEIYDLIFLSQLVTLKAERSGYTLVENSAYTVEAFQEYLAHLSPKGQIGIKLYDEPTLTRALSTALAAFNQQGLSDQQALQHIIALLDARSQPAIPLLVISKSAFTADDSLSLGAVARQVGFTPLYLPGVLAQPPLDAVQAGELTFRQVIATMPYDYSPTTDDHPFFYQFERGLPGSLRNLLLGAVVTVMAGSVLVFTWQRQLTPASWRLAALYFAALGFGFILVEIALIQQTRLFIGHPTLAITAVLGTLLISGGVGSGLAGRLPEPQRRALPAGPILAIVVLLAAWILLWPGLSDLFMTGATPLRVLVVVLALMPLGMLMGIPFPLGLRAVDRLGRQQVAVAWAVNGILTVVGSITAMVLAIEIGFTAVLVAGGLSYAIAAGIAASLSRP